VRNSNRCIIGYEPLHKLRSIVCINNFALILSTESHDPALDAQLVYSAFHLASCAGSVELSPVLSAIKYREGANSKENETIDPPSSSAFLI
jgi:hypothetical protein